MYTLATSGDCARASKLCNRRGAPLQSTRGQHSANSGHSQLASPDMSGPMAEIPNIQWVIASDVRNRDGIGVELYIDETLALEVFRDDTKRTREVTLHQQKVSLELLEEAIAVFKRDIPRDFLE